MTDTDKIRNIAIIAHVEYMRHPRRSGVGFSLRRAKNVIFARAALPVTAEGQVW